MALSSSQQSAALAHLLRRAGFGASPSQWQEFERQGIAATTESLLHPEKTRDHLDALLSEIGGDYVDFNDINSVKEWWLYRMVHTRRPLEEKMTLFWHNHFATANYKVDNAPRMWAQNQLFRRYGLGSFRTLLGQVARDPAMLVWLDGGENRVGAPNENFGREVMELFTLGRGNGYTEKDVQEAARCFTGWRGADTPTGFVYDPTRHDDGEKTVLGRTGNWHTDDLVDILAAHPATAKTLCAKLFRFFVHDNPSEAQIERLSEVYFQNNFEIRAVLSAIFHSDDFYSDAARWAKIKSPTEFAVMTIRELQAPLSAVGRLGDRLNQMGQDLFYPPNVRGWVEGRSWINTRTLLARVNFASTLAEEMNRRVSLLDRLRGFASSEAPINPSGAMNAPAMNSMGAAAMNSKGAAAMNSMSAPAMSSMSAPAMNAPAMNAPAMAPPTTSVAARASTAMPDAGGAVQVLWDALFRGMEMPPATRAQLVAYVAGDKPENLTKPIARDKLPGVVHLLVSLPEYQLC